MMFKFIKLKPILFLLFTIPLLKSSYGYISDTTINCIDTLNNDTLASFKRGTVVYELNRRSDKITIAIPLYFNVNDLIKKAIVRNRNSASIEIHDFMLCFSDSLLKDTIGYLKDGAHKIIWFRSPDILLSNINIDFLIDNSKSYKADLIFDIPIYPFLVTKDWNDFLIKLIKSNKFYNSKYQEILSSLRSIFAYFPDSISDSMNIYSKDNIKYLELSGYYDIGSGHITSILVYDDNHLIAIWYSKMIDSPNRIKMSKGYLYFYKHITNVTKITDFIESNWLQLRGIGAPKMD